MQEYTGMQEKMQKRMVTKIETLQTLFKKHYVFHCTLSCLNVWQNFCKYSESRMLVIWLF